MARAELPSAAQCDQCGGPAAVGYRLDGTPMGGPIWLLACSLHEVELAAWVSQQAIVADEVRGDS